MAELEATIYEVKNGAAWITLNRPQNRNALSAVLVSELYDHLLAANEDRRALDRHHRYRPRVLCRGGSQESAGRIRRRAPLRTVSASADHDHGEPEAGDRRGQRRRLRRRLSLVGASDIVVTAEEVQFSFSEVRIGVIPAVISVVCIPKLGTHHAMRLFVTGKRFTGAEAVEMGFAPPGGTRADLETAVEEELDMINRGGPNAVVECKRLVRRVPQLSIEEGFRETAEWSGRMFRSEEGAEGMAAFREKRDAAWIES